MGFFSGCSKWLLFVSNFLVFVSIFHLSFSFWGNAGNFKILSCVGLGLGIWILVDKSSFVDLLEQVEMCNESK